MRDVPYCVYILTNSRRTVLYGGVTNGLEKRLSEHRNKIDPKCFTARYNATVLVHYESTQDVLSAIAREKTIKGWTRAKKDALVTASNPEWKDLSSQ